MRDEFVRVLSEKAGQNKNIMLLTGDLGFGVLTEFAHRFPDQYLNVGVAEQNMAGIAAGLALEGKTVFTYSIANFNTMRCLEQIRNDICYHNANVKVVSVGGGFCYGPLGFSHHATEDLAIMGAMPNITVMAPGDKMEASLTTSAACETPGPFYIRLGRGGEPLLYASEPLFAIGEAIEFHASDCAVVAILSTGGILHNVLLAREILESRGIPCCIYSMHTLRPFDENLVRRLIDRVKIIVTVEEHIDFGGLGSRVACVVSAEPGYKPMVLRLGLKERFTSAVGDQEYLRELNGLSPMTIATAVAERLYTNGMAAPIDGQSPVSSR